MWSTRVLSENHYCWIGIMQVLKKNLEEKIAFEILRGFKHQVFSIHIEDFVRLNIKGLALQ